MKEDNFMPLVVAKFQEAVEENNARSYLTDAIVSEYLSLMQQHKAILAAMEVLGNIMNACVKEGEI